MTDIPFRAWKYYKLTIIYSAVMSTVAVVLAVAN